MIDGVPLRFLIWEGGLPHNPGEENQGLSTAAGAAPQQVARAQASVVALR